jgi:hypothetical protein
MLNKVTNFCSKKVRMIHHTTGEAPANWSGEAVGISRTNHGAANAGALTIRMPSTATPRSTSSCSMRSPGGDGVSVMLLLKAMGPAAARPRHQAAALLGGGCPGERCG